MISISLPPAVGKIADVKSNANLGVVLEFLRVIYGRVWRNNELHIGRCYFPGMYI